MRRIYTDTHFQQRHYCIVKLSVRGERIKGGEDPVAGRVCAVEQGHLPVGVAAGLRVAQHSGDCPSIGGGYGNIKPRFVLIVANADNQRVAVVMGIVLPFEDTAIALFYHGQACTGAATPRRSCYNLTMNRNIASLMRHIAALVSIFALVACAGASTAPPTESPAPTPVATRSTPAVASPVPSPTPGPRSLRLWVAEEEPVVAVVQDWMEDFTAATGAPVEVIAKPVDGLRLSLATATLVGDPPPDLLWGNQEDLAGLLADGQLQPFTAPLPADVLPALLAAATAEGQRWGMPLAAQGALLLLRNRAVAPEAPATSDELIVFSRRGATSDIAGLVMAWEEARWLLPWLYGFGGALPGPDETMIRLDTPELTAALGLLRELYAAAPSGNTTYARGQRLFEQGYAAFAIDGDWAIPRYRQVGGVLDLGIAPMPIVPATGRPALGPLGGVYLMVHRDLGGELLEQAYALAAWLTDSPIQAQVAGSLKRLPARTGVLVDPAVTSDAALAAAAVGAGLAPGLPPTKTARCMLVGMNIWLPDLLKGTLDEHEAPKQMQQAAEDCMTRSEG